MKLICVALAMSLAGCASTWRPLGQRASGARLERMQASHQWRDGRFKNRLKQKSPALGALLDGALNADQVREPSAPVEVTARTRDDFDEPPPLRVTWLGHSSFLLEIEGARFLVDPVFGERASPFDWAGPARFHEPPLPFDELPRLDAIVISHDHYDHLDHRTVELLRETALPFIVPLGVGAHLEHWGIDAARITELDWWQETRAAGVRLVSTPSRHFSGRGPGMNDSTLWSGWAFVGRDKRAFYSGDTSMHPEFLEIGERLGPFDITLFEVGAYNQNWPDSHLGPEQAVAAHLAVGGKVMVPVHWGTFNLSFHAWVAPGERVIAEAERRGVTLAMVRPGGSIVPEMTSIDRWWPEVPFDDAAAYPVRSSRFRPQR